MLQPLNYFVFLLFVLYPSGIFTVKNVAEVEKSLKSASDDLVKAGMLTKEGLDEKLTSMNTLMGKVDTDIKALDKATLQKIYKEGTTKDAEELKIATAISQGVIGGIDDFVKGYQTKSPRLFLTGL